MAQFSHLPMVLPTPGECNCSMHKVSAAWVLALALVTASDTISGGLGADLLAPPASLPGSHLTRKTTLFSYFTWASLLGFRADQRKAAPDTGSEPHQTILAGCRTEAGTKGWIPIGHGVNGAREMCNAAALEPATSCNYRRVGA